MPAGALILASASPRRVALLQQLGYASATVVPSIDETLQPHEDLAQSVLRLARAKAIDVAGRASGSVVLAADTLVGLKGQIFGKPEDFAAAVAIHQALGGRWHQVLTAIAVHDGQRVRTRLSRSAVRLRPLSAQELRAYWASGEPQDKAGAYAIQGLAATFITGLRGSYSGVMGLPLAETAALLRAVGLPPPFLASAP